MPDHLFGGLRMEFVDTIVRVLGGCTGLLEVLTILFDGLAVYLGFKTFQRHRQVADKLASVHGKAPLKKPNWRPALIAGALGLIFTFLTAWKYVRGLG
jgi:hypothetical protein